MRADPVGAADGVGGVDGRGGDGLGGGQLHVAAGQGDDELHGFVPGGAGVAVGGQGQDPARFEDFLRRGVFAFGQAEGGAGQRDGDRVRLCPARRYPHRRS